MSDCQKAKLAACGGDGYYFLVSVPKDSECWTMTVKDAIASVNDGSIDKQVHLLHTVKFKPVGGGEIELKGDVVNEKFVSVKNQDNTLEITFDSPSYNGRAYNDFLNQEIIIKSMPPTPYGSSFASIQDSPHLEVSDQFDSGLLWGVGVYPMHY